MSNFLKNDDKLKDFLKEYVEILREGVDITNDLPLSMFVSMPMGGIKILTKDSRTIGYIVMDEGDCPSMPVGPAAMTYASLFVNLINEYYAHFKDTG